MCTAFPQVFRKFRRWSFDARWYLFATLSLTMIEVLQILHLVLWKKPGGRQQRRPPSTKMLGSAKVADIRTYGTMADRWYQDHFICLLWSIIPEMTIRYQGHLICTFSHVILSFSVPRYEFLGSNFRKFQSHYHHQKHQSFQQLAWNFLRVRDVVVSWAEERPEEPPEEIRLGDIEEAMVWEDWH